MARAIGLDAGEYAIKAVELDGSYKKTRLAKVHVDVLPPEGGSEFAAERLAGTADRVLAAAGITGDGLTMGVPGREAVLRMVEVPFTGRDAIRKVIKGEVESAIHSHNVDDMVVDFHVVEETEDGARVLVVAVPKAGLRTDLMALERVGIEPERVDLDAMALFRCAEWCNAFGPLSQTGASAVASAVVEEAGSIDDDREEEVYLLAEEGTGTPLRLVVDIGYRGTRILLVQNGELRDMRTIRLGDGSAVAEVASHHALPEAAARDALRECMGSGADVQVERASAPLVGDESTAAEGEEEQGAALVPVHYGEAAKAMDRFRLRLRRELERFLTAVGTGGSVEAVWVTGGGSTWPGVEDTLAEVFGVTPRVLPVLECLGHKLSEEEAGALERELAVAVGLALPDLGGPPGFNFRQEDLVFAKGFERIKFPLALFCMVALFALVVFGVKRHNDLGRLEMEYGKEHVSKDRNGRDVISFHGYLHLVNDSRWFDNPKYMSRRDYRKLKEDLLELPVFGRLRAVNNALRRLLREADASASMFEEHSLPSGLAVLSKFSEIVMQIEPQLGRYLVTELDLNISPRGSRRLAVKAVFRGEDMRNKARIYREALAASIGKPDSPFLEVDQGKETLLKGETGENAVLRFDLNLTIKDDFRITEDK